MASGDGGRLIQNLQNTYRSNQDVDRLVIAALSAGEERGRALQKRDDAPGAAKAKQDRMDQGLFVEAPLKETDDNPMEDADIELSTEEENMLTDTHPSTHGLAHPHDCSGDPTEAEVKQMVADHSDTPEEWEQLMADHDNTARDRDAVYIAGPMSGIADLNAPEFDRVEALLRKANLFKEIINPANNFSGHNGLRWDTYLRLAISQVAQATAVVVLPDWEDSSGATLEVETALGLGVPVYRFDEDDEGRFVGLGTLDSADKKEHDSPSEPRGIEQEAHGLVHGDREASYGHPASDFVATGRINGATIGRWLESEDYTVLAGGMKSSFPDIPPRIVALMQQGVKISRESANPSHDNRVDGIGYWLCADRIVEGY